MTTTNKLLPGEKIDFDRAEKKKTVSLTDEQINEKYVTGEVRIVTEQARYHLHTIPGMIESGVYLLNPDFQRRHRWDKEKQSRLIESFIMNVPVPPVFLYEDAFSHYEVMDGQQRLTAIKDFYRNQYPLEGLQFWPELNGRHYNLLPSQVQKGIDRRYLSSIVLLKETAKYPKEATRLKQLVFQRINSGGVRLEHQETRNAIYAGPLNDLCVKLSSSQYLRKMWDIPETSSKPDQEGSEGPGVDLGENKVYAKMHDAELVLRFFAYRQIQNSATVSALGINDYFDIYLREGNDFKPATLQRLESLFVQTIKVVFEVLGQQAFWRWLPKKDRWQKPPNKVIYDPLMYAFSHHLVAAPKLIERKKMLVEDLKKLYASEDGSIFAGRKTNKADMIRRDKLMCELVEKFAAQLAMRASLRELEVGVADLHQCLDGTEALNKFLSPDLLVHVSEPVTKLLKDLQSHLSGFVYKRTFDYNAFIVSLYGLLERFVENLAAQFIEHIRNSVTTYADLPTEITTRHYALSADLLKRALIESRNIHSVTPESVVKNLHSCFSTPTDFQINVYAFTHHSANFRHDAINDFFTQIGVPAASNQVAERPAFKAYIKNPDSGVSSEDHPTSAISTFLNDLAQRRNEVAHGDASSVLSLDELRTYINFIKHYASALYEVVRHAAVRFDVARKGKPLKVINIINNQIVCVRLEGGEITLTDFVVSKVRKPNDGFHFRVSPVLALEVDGQRRDQIKATQPIDVGIQLEPGAKRNHDFLLVRGI
jgi:hypothetical protein